MAQDILKRMIDMMEETQKPIEDEAGKRHQEAYVPIDVGGKGDNLEIRADMPGLDKDDINIHITEKNLEITAESDQTIERTEKDHYMSERKSRNYYRSISLPVRVRPDSTEAEYENGVLTIMLEKSGAHKGHEVEIE